MAIEFKVTVQDTPGTLARLGRILGEAGVNIEALQGTSREGKGFIQFVPNDEDKAARSRCGGACLQQARGTCGLGPGRAGHARRPDARDVQGWY